MLVQLQVCGVCDNDFLLLCVNVGYQVQFFDGDNFIGVSVVCIVDMGCLVDQVFNDCVIFIVVFKIVLVWLQQIEVELFSVMVGVQIEVCIEGGLNVGWIDIGDWMVYNSIIFFMSGSYCVEYCVVSIGGGMLLLDLNVGSIQFGQFGVFNIGGWQNWIMILQMVNINVGIYNVGVFVQQGGWNLNWIKFMKFQVC